MEALLKGVLTSENMKRVFRFCEKNNIKVLHGDVEFKREEISWRDCGGYYNYIYNFNYENIENYFKFEFPEGPPPRGRVFNGVNAVVTGVLHVLNQ